MEGEFNEIIERSLRNEKLQFKLNFCGNSVHEISHGKWKYIDFFAFLK